MVRPIVHRHPAIDDRKPCQAPVMHGFDHPLLYRRNKVAWNGSADHLVFKLEPLPARQRREFQPAITILAMPTGLLLIFPLCLCRGANGFAVRNLRHMKHHFRTVLAAQFFERKIDMQLAHPAQHHFLRIGMSRKFERRIFFDQLMQSETDFFDIGIGLRLNRKGQHRTGKHRLWITDGSLFVTERVAGLRIFEFPNRDDLPCSGRRHVPYVSSPTQRRDVRFSLYCLASC